MSLHRFQGSIRRLYSDHHQWALLHNIVLVRKSNDSVLQFSEDNDNLLTRKNVRF
jgi:hypothetical protein